MKQFATWLVAPWRGVTRSGLTPERKAALVGISATVGFLYGGWLLLATKDALNERNALAVILAPDAVPVPLVTKVEGSSSCTVYGETRKPGTGGRLVRLWCENYRRGPNDIFGNPTWVGDYVYRRSPTSPSYRGNRRIDGLRSIRDDVADSAVRLAVPGGVALAVMIGVSTGFHYLRKTRGEDDI